MHKIDMTYEHMTIWTESERYLIILLTKKKNKKKIKISETRTLGLIQIFLYGKFIYNCNIFFVDFLKNLGFSWLWTLW